MVLAIERAVVERLAAALAPMPVEAFPHQGYVFGAARGAALVMATDLVCPDVDDVGTAVQTGTLTLEVVILSRHLRDGAGVWEMFGAARTVLLGCRPAPGATPLRLAAARLDSQDDGVWALATRWQTSIPLVPVGDDAGSGPSLMRITAPDSLGQTTEVP